jgi:hypothetical protein
MQFLLLVILIIFSSCQVKESDSSALVQNHTNVSNNFILSTTLNKSYKAAEVIPLKLTFPKIVTVTGTPRLGMTVGSTLKAVNYTSGSGTKVLLFNYTVQAGESDTNGISVASTLDLNGGTITYDGTKTPSTLLKLPSLTSVLIDSTDPSIILVTPATSGTYTSGMALSFSFKFSEKVSITGTPRLPIELTSGTVYANYFSGSGSDTLVFKYSVTPSDEDTDGISLQPIDLNAGTIKDAALNSANLTYSSPNTSAVLVSGNLPVITSIGVPANATYTTGQNLNFTVNFNQAVLVTLVPRLAITTEDGTLYADYLSGGGTSALIFRYTVASGDADLNGITLVSPIETNGGAIQNLTATTNALLSFTLPTTSGIKIDGLNTVLSSVTPPDDGWYKLGDNLDFTVNYSSNVTVSGTPKLAFTLGSTNVNASYVSGSGTKDLVFRYTVAAGNLDIDGIQIVSPISLNGGTIKNASNVAAPLIFTPPTTTGVLVDGIIPAITTVTAPASKTYYNSENIDFTFSLSENVTVTGAPSFNLTIGASTKTAVYLSGDGTNTLTFRYTVAAGDFDNDGISALSPMALNGGTITDVAGNGLSTNAFTPPVTSGVLVDANVASISSITPPSNSTYKTGQNVDFVANFTQPVTVTGTPRLQLDVGGDTIYADYLSGSGTSALTFRYTVQSADKDVNGLALVSPIDLNGGEIVDASTSNATITFTLPTTSGVLIDGVDLVISSISPPADKTYAIGQNLDFIINYNDNVVVTGLPQLQLTVGSASINATYLSGTGTNALTFRYSVAVSDLDLDGVDTTGAALVLNSGTLKDEFGDNANNSITAANYPEVKVDGVRPLISSVAAPSSKTYLEAEDLDFIVTTSEVVNITGNPRFPLTVGADSFYATYVSGTGTTSLTFRYTVANGDSDTDGIDSVSPIQLNSGTIKDAAGNSLTLLTFTPPASTGVKVNGVGPMILSLTPPANGRYTTGQDLDFTVVFDQPVVVTLIPRISITAESGTIYANYVSGGGTDTLTFRYTVLAGHYDTNGILLLSPLQLNGGAIQNLSLSASAILTYTVPNTASLLIDGIDPVISSVTPPADKWYVLNDTMDFIVNYNYPVTISGTPKLSFTIGTSSITANYLSGSGTKNITFRYIVTSSDLDPDGVQSNAPLIISGAGIKDAFGDNADLNFTPPTTTGVLVDGIVPTISTISGPSAGTYYNNQNLDFSVVFSENVTVIGASTIPLVIGSSNKNAVYVSGTGTNTLIYRYTVVGGDLDTNGITVTSPVVLSPGASIKDQAGNAPAGLTFTPPTTSSVLVDGTIASISSITPPVDGVYKSGQNVDFIVNFSRDVFVTGTPKLQLDIGGATAYANYLSGSSTANLTFRYVVQAGTKDTNGIGLTSPLILTVGTITDSSLNNATLNFTAPNTSGVLIDGIDLVISSITPPADKYYALGENLDFSVNYNNSAVVTGSPRIQLTVGSSTRYATYVSGSGTPILVFRYSVGASDLDTDGIDTVGSTLDLNSGTIQDEFSDNADLSMTAANYPNKKVDGIVPTITSVSAPANGTYGKDQHLDFIVTTSESINVTGTPRIPVIIGSTTNYLTYTSGSGTSSLIFRYTVTMGDVDNDGVTLSSSIDLNSGSMSDLAGNALNSLSFTAPNTTGVLVNGIAPYIASISGPANGKYTTNQNVDFTVNFDQPVIVTLIPRMEITTEGGTVYADYISGGGTSSLTFRYTVTTGDFDTDGIELVSPLDPNGGAIQNVTFTSNAQLIFTPPSTSGILIDGIDPVISSVTPPANDWYILADNLDFVVNYDYKVNVTGTPKISMDVGGNSVTANYLSGSGTTALTFRYTVVANDDDKNGVQTSSPISLSGGTIKDIFGDNVSLTFTPPTTTGVLVDAVAPVISSATGPSAGSYSNDENVDFSIVFSENVTVTGTPKISLTVGSSSKSANYSSGTGTNTIIFRYTVATGDEDSDGISNSSPLVLNGGSITDEAGNNITNLTFTTPNTSSVLVFGTAASILSITPPANATYKTTQNVDFTVNFSRSVTVTGTPRLQLNIGGTTAYANYQSGTGSTNLLFRYTVAAGAKDLDGIALTSPLLLSTGSIIDGSSNNAVLTFSPPTTTGILIDGIDLVISSISPPADKVYGLGENLDFTINYNNSAVISGTPRLKLTVGASTKYATYVSGTGTSALLFRYTVITGDVDTDGIDTVGSVLELNSGTIKDEFGDNADLAITATNYPNKKVDAVSPYISSVTPPSAATYGQGDNVDFTVVMSENVTVTGSPRIALTVGVTTRYLTYTSGSGSSSLVFRYTVPFNDVDNDGVVLTSPLDLNSGTIKDVANNSLSPLTFTLPNSSGVLVNGLAPFITSVTGPTAGRYLTGNNLNFTVNFNQAVTVTGLPSIALNIGGSTFQAIYSGGSGTNALTFTYQVVAGNLDADGIASSSPVNLNGGTIKNAALTSATLTFTPPNTSSVLVDGIDVSISSITPPADGTYKIGDAVSFIVNYNYNATVTGTPRIQLTVGSTTYYAVYASGSGSTAHTFTYTVNAGDLDTDGISTVGASINLNGGTITDAFGDTATVTFTAMNYPAKKVDGIRSTITGMSASANGTYIAGQNIDFTTTFSEAVSVDSSVRLVVTVGVTTRYATYFSGTGTSTIVFRYTVQSGDSDTNGIALASAVDLNGGTVTDVPGNTQTNLLFTPPTLTGVLVGGVSPTITNITPPTSKTYIIGEAINFTVTFSESVNVTGSPILTLNVGGSNKSASYVSGTGTSNLVFRYTVVMNDLDTDGVASVSPLVLSGGTINSVSTTAAADLTFTGATYSGVKVDGVPPKITSITLPTDFAYQSGHVTATRRYLQFTANIDKAVTVIGTPRLVLTIGPNTTAYADYVSAGSTSTALIFKYTVAISDIDFDGIEFGNANKLDFNGGTIKGTAVANDLDAALGTNVMKKIFVVPTSIRAWYDVSDTSNRTPHPGNPTTRLTGLSDKVGTYNLTATGIDYSQTGFNGTTYSYLRCASATSGSFLTSTTTQRPAGILIAFKAPTGSPSVVFGNSGSDNVMLQFRSSTTLRCGNAYPYCQVYNSLSATGWTNNSLQQDYTGKFTLGQYGALAVKWEWSSFPSTNQPYNLCSMTSGEIPEVILLNQTAITATQLTHIRNYFQTRYGFTFNN